MIHDKKMAINSIHEYAKLVKQTELSEQTASLLADALANLIDNTIYTISEVDMSIQQMLNKFDQSQAEHKAALDRTFAYYTELSDKNRARQDKKILEQENRFDKNLAESREYFNKSIAEISDRTVRRLTRNIGAILTVLTIIGSGLHYLGH